MRPLRQKLLINSLSVAVLIFLIVGTVVYYGLTNLSSQFLQFSAERTEATKKNFETISKQNVDKIREIFETALERKGKNLVRKDSVSMTPMVEDNSFQSVRTFLEKNVADDPEI